MISNFKWNSTLVIYVIEALHNCHGVWALSAPMPWSYVTQLLLHAETDLIPRKDFWFNIGQNPSVSKSNWLPVVWYFGFFFFINLEYIP